MEIGTRPLIIIIIAMIGPSLLLNLGDSLLILQNDIDSGESPNPSHYKPDFSQTAMSAPIRKHILSHSSLSSIQNYTEHSNIVITSNSDFAAQKTAENWTGDGSLENPYIIQGYNITFNGHNILIENVTAHFVIRDCLLISTISLPRLDPYDNGIAIYNSTNGIVANNTILGASDSGIFVGWSEIDVVGNHFSHFDNSIYRGIIFQDSSGTVSFNVVSDFGEDGIYVLDSRNVNVESNVITNGDTGITIEASSGILVSNNVLNDGPGIRIINGNYCSVSNNEISYASGEGIVLIDTLFSTVEYNSIIEASSHGIVTYNSFDCFLSGNRIMECEIGIYIEDVFQSTFSFNYIVSNRYLGIQLYSGNGNIIYGNLLENGWNAEDDGADNQWDDGVSIGNYWSHDFGLDPVLIDGSGGSVDSFPIEIIPPDVLMPIIYSLPIIHATSYTPVVLTWIGWSASGSYTLYLNNTQIEAGLWAGSGSFQIPLHVLPDGIHTYQLNIRSGTFITTSTAVIRVPSFDLLNDYDGDKMYDLWELEHNFDPAFDADASMDADDDGLTNLQEHNLGTDPHSPDSDGDSFSDLWEVNNGFDPLSPDIPIFEYVMFFQGYVIGIPAAIAVLGIISTLYRRLPEEKKSRLPIKTPISFASFLKLSVIFGILLAVPSEIHIREEYGQEPPFNYFSIGSVLVYYSRWQTAGFTDIWSSDADFISPATMFAAIVIILPAIFLMFKLRNRPADAPVLDLGLATLFATIILTSYLVENFPILEVGWIFQSVPSWILLNFGTLTILVLILLPIFSREAFLWGSERSSEEEEKTSRRRIPLPSKYSALGYLWGLAAFLLPLVAIVNIWGPETITLRYESPLYSFRQSIRDAAIPGNLNDWMEISLGVYRVFDFVSYLIVSVFHIIFAFHVLRYLRGMMERRRVFQLGLLSILAPIIYYALIASNPDIGELYAIPTPIVLIIGVVALMMIQPNKKRIMVEESRDDRRATEPYSDVSVDDLRIDVPLIYYLKSKLRGLLRRSSKSQSESA
ncbi:MAG: right-handed parallel beta-helix repeat-containing protein [Candidatus Thorarchaeota archaeon]